MGTFQFLFNWFTGCRRWCEKSCDYFLCKTVVYDGASRQQQIRSTDDVLQTATPSIFFVQSDFVVRLNQLGTTSQQVRCPLSSSSSSPLVLLLSSVLCRILVSSVVLYGHDITVTGWPQTWNTQGFLWTWKTRGILREFCAASGKHCNRESIFSSSFKYLCKTAVDWVNGIVRISESSDPAQ